MFLNPLVSWDDASSVNIPIIDDQHRGIIGIINTLHFFIEKKKADYYLNTIFAMIYNYTKIHFATEEELMREIRYPGYKEHKFLHENLVRESFSVANASMRYKDPRIYLDFLEHW